jgi:hypothetical protein
MENHVGGAGAQIIIQSSLKAFPLKAGLDRVSPFVHMFTDLTALRVVKRVDRDLKFVGELEERL